MVVQLRQVKNQLERTLINEIDVSDMSNRSENDLEKIKLSRSYAVYSLISLASAETNTAIQSIVDGYRDNGIDAIYYDEYENTLWIVQSKWIEKGRGEPTTGDTNKFIRGIKHLIDFKFSNFNEKVNRQKDIIEKALENPKLKIQIVLAYSGTKLGKDNKSIIDEFILENNEISELFFFKSFSLSEAHRALSGSLDKSIDMEFVLTHWGQNEEPYKAIYGQISAKCLADLWNTHKEDLFSKNIRSFVGLSDVNEGIKNTLQKNPENFFYFNNGVTVLCDKIQKTAKGGTGKSLGTFHCEGISIVNGAQTVGTIGSSCVQNEECSQAKVFIRLISLENCSPEFSLSITKATNTQNKVENRDFIALDDLQNRLKREFALDGINYYYKRSDKQYELDEHNCDFEEAIIALACASEEIKYSIYAKDKVGKLWEDLSKPPYTKLFHNKIKAQELWRMIIISRVLEQKLHQSSSNCSDNKKAIYVHGKKFILHMLFTYIGNNILLVNDKEFENYYNNELNSVIDKCIYQTVKIVNEKSKNNGGIYHFFRKSNNHKQLKEEILRKHPI